MKPLPPKIKKATEILIEYANISLQILIGFFNISIIAFLLIANLLAFSEDYFHLQKSFPIHPARSIWIMAWPYFTMFALFWYLYKRRKQIGHLKTLSVVLTIWIFLLLIQLLLNAYIFNLK